MKKETSTQSAKAKTRRPFIRGRNSPKNVHKAFRAHGNKAIMRATLERDQYGHGYKSEVA